MAKRHKDALAIQEGACNPSGIANAIVRAQREILDEPGSRGTDSVTSDPAVRLMVHQLAYICGVVAPAQDLPIGDDYLACMKACREAVDRDKQPDLPAQLRGAQEVGQTTAGERVFLWPPKKPH